MPSSDPKRQHPVREDGRGLAARAQRARPQHPTAPLGVGGNPARRHPVQALEHHGVHHPVGQRRRRRGLGADLALPDHEAVVGPERDQGAVVLEDEQPTPGHDRRELEQLVRRHRPHGPERRAQVGAGRQVAAAVLGVAVVGPDEGGAALGLLRRGARASRSGTPPSSCGPHPARARPRTDTRRGRRGGGRWRQRRGRSEGAADGERRTAACSKRSPMVEATPDGRAG